MTLTELRYIVTLAQERHFGQAAQRCHVSQPTLSIAVKKLEQELGVEIFERSKSSVRTTPTGEEIVAQAQRVLEEAAAIKDIATSGKDQLNSPLQVGAIFTIGPYLFPYLIRELHQLAPQMPLVIEESFTATLRQRLRKGELDVIIVAMPFTEPDVVTQPIYDEPFVVLLPAKHKLAKQESIKPAELKDESILLLGAGHCFRDQVLDVIPHLAHSQEDNKQVRSTRTVGSSIETLRYMVATGLGISILPLSAALGHRHQNDMLVTRPLDDPAAFRTTALAWRASFPRHKAVDVLRESILKTPLPGMR